MTLPYSLIRTVEPTAEPVTLDELKQELNVDHSADDAKLTRLLAGAREAVETATGRALITQTWQLVRDNWPCGPIVLYNSPLQSVTSITYVDTAGDTQTWDSGSYVVDTASSPGLVRLAYSESYPSIRADARGITVTYVCGYGDSSTDVPQALRHAVLLQARMDYDGICDEVDKAFLRRVMASTAGVYP